MFFSIFFFLAASEGESEEQIKCPYNNTEITADGMCVCVPGFVSDPKNPELGCWKCADKCHPLARCMYPGECVCHQGLNGTGVNCFSAFPLSFAQKSLNTLEEGGFELTIEHKSPGAYKVPAVYIQIGHEIFISKTFTNENAKFIIPARIHGFKNVTISYDKLNWANDIKVWYFEKTMNNKFIAESTPFVFALVVIVLLGTCLMHGKQIIFEKEEEEETILPSPQEINDIE